MLCVRWYLRYKLSFRDLVEMMAERGLSLAHTTIMRWIQRYAPEFEKRPVGQSWRVDETYVKIKGRWTYLYRAVDKEGKTVDVLLRAKPGPDDTRPASSRCPTTSPRSPALAPELNRSRTGAFGAFRRASEMCSRIPAGDAVAGVLFDPFRAAADRAAGVRPVVQLVRRHRRPFDGFQEPGACWMRGCRSSSERRYERQRTTDWSVAGRLSNPISGIALISTSAARR